MRLLPLPRRHPAAAGTPATSVKGRTASEREVVVVVVVAVVVALIVIVLVELLLLNAFVDFRRPENGPPKPLSSLNPLNSLKAP